MPKRICLIMILIIKKEENVNHAGFDDAKKSLLDTDCHHQKGGECESCRFQVLMMLKRIFLIMVVIIKKRENMNHAAFDDAEKNSLDNDCHH